VPRFGGLLLLPSYVWLTARLRFGPPHLGVGAAAALISVGVGCLPVPGAPWFFAAGFGSYYVFAYPAGAKRAWEQARREVRVRRRTRRLLAAIVFVTATFPMSMAAKGTTATGSRLAALVVVGSLVFLGYRLWAAATGDEV
jgi:hypothetical protein